MLPHATTTRCNTASWRCCSTYTRNPAKRKLALVFEPSHGNVRAVLPFPLPLAPAVCWRFGAVFYRVGELAAVVHIARTSASIGISPRGRDFVWRHVRKKIRYFSTGRRIQNGRLEHVGLREDIASLFVPLSLSLSRSSFSRSPSAAKTFPLLPPVFALLPTIFSLYAHMFSLLLLFSSFHAYALLSALSLSLFLLS